MLVLFFYLFGLICLVNFNWWLIFDEIYLWVWGDCRNNFGKNCNLIGLKIVFVFLFLFFLLRLLD